MAQKKKKPRSKSIQDSTAHYEEWMRKHINVLEDDLRAKHEAMTVDSFSFLRATFYRWAQLLSPELCPAVAHAPTVLGVGDLHIENFGTWRDAEGRLIWGVNDFDEATDFPYTIDLVRLATSALIAIWHGHLGLDRNDACQALLDGYTKGLEKGGKPFVLSELNVWLRIAVTGVERAPELFWGKLEALEAVEDVPSEIHAMLEASLPEKGLEFRTAHRLAGLGSLGRERYTVLAQWKGGNIAREAKTLLPSAALWAAGSRDKTIRYADILKAAVRAPDPFLHVQDHWVLRRLSPYCSRVELEQLPYEKDEARLLKAMGREVANIHWGTPAALDDVRRDLEKRKARWLREAAETMVEATLKDWKDWRKAWRLSAPAENS